MCCMKTKAHWTNEWKSELATSTRFLYDCIFNEQNIWKKHGAGNNRVFSPEALVKAIKPDDNQNGLITRTWS